MDTTKVIDMQEFVESKTGETTMIGTPECTIQLQVEHLAKHGKTMLMMYDATGEQRYLDQARLDYRQAKSLLNAGFVRPQGVLLAS